MELEDMGDKNENNYEEKEDETFFDYNENDYEEYKDNFDWSDYHVDQLSEKEKEKIVHSHYQRDKETESRFDETTSEDVRRIINTIQDDRLRRNVIEEIADRDTKEKVESIELRNILLDSLERSKFEINLWDEDLDDHEKFYYQQKVANLNQALTETFIDDDQADVRDLIEKELTTSLELDGKILAYMYKGKDIVILKENDSFESVPSPELNEFISRIERLQESSARAIFSTYLETNDTRVIKSTAIDYIAELREEQKKSVERITSKEISLGKLEEAIREMNEQEEVIEAIVQKKRFILKLDIIKKTVGRLFRHIFSSIRENPLAVSGVVFSIVTGLTSLILGLENAKRIIHGVQSSIPQAVKNSIRDFTSTLYLKYLMEKTALGQTFFKFLSFLGIEGVSLAVFTAMLSLGSFSLVLFTVASGLLVLFGKPLGLLEYIEYVSCTILESEYLKKKLQVPYNVAEVISKYKGITIDSYYALIKGKEGSAFSNFFSPVARFNFKLVAWIIRHYIWIVRVIGLIGLYLVYRFIVWLLWILRKWRK